MKNKLTLLTIGAILALSFSAANADHHCANLPAMKLTIDVYHLDLNDKTPICVTLPGVFKIKIHNPAGFVNEDDVIVEQKGDPAEARVLISGANDGPTNKITVKVEPNGDVDFGEEFDFWIRVDGVGELDPKVRIVDPGEMNALMYLAVGDTMDSFGLEAEDAGKLQPPPEG